MFLTVGRVLGYPTQVKLTTALNMALLHSRDLGEADYSRMAEEVEPHLDHSHRAMPHCIHNSVAAVSNWVEEHKVRPKTSDSPAAHRSVGLVEDMVGSLAGLPGTVVGFVGLADSKIQTQGQ